MRELQPESMEMPPALQWNGMRSADWVRHAGPKSVPRRCVPSHPRVQCVGGQLGWVDGAHAEHGVVGPHSLGAEGHVESLHGCKGEGLAMLLPRQGLPVRAIDTADVLGRFATRQNMCACAAASSDLERGSCVV